MEKAGAQITRIAAKLNFRVHDFFTCQRIHQREIKSERMNLFGTLIRANGLGTGKFT
jgi:hypothetical protein